MANIIIVYMYILLIKYYDLIDNLNIALFISFYSFIPQF